jgi:2-methylcitrate dehydratase PrpD
MATVGNESIARRGGSMQYSRKEFVRLAAAAAAGGLLLGGLAGTRKAVAHAGMPAYVTNALEHQTYDMYQEWFSWLRSAGVPGYLVHLQHRFWLTR